MKNSQRTKEQILEEYRRRAERAEADADIRREELYAAVPQIREIDGRVSKLGLRAFEAAMAGGDVQKSIRDLRAETESMLKTRAELMAARGYAEDYDQPRYECPTCSDTGYVRGTPCVCLRRRLFQEGMRSSGLAALLPKQNFSNFSLDYYRSNPEIFREMSENLQNVRYFAEHFGTEEEGVPSNLLFVGGTGLGKTHLSTAIAGTVLEKGYDVFYNSAVGMLSDFEARRFGTGMASGDDDADVARYTDCDLLILDDLGTEVVNQFSLSCLYHVLNTRLNLGKATVISTNLTPQELRRTYTDRIASRLFGEYHVIRFRGIDVRQQKM